MCGIAGYFGRRMIEDTVMRKCLGLMQYRGPDNVAFSRPESTSDLHVALLHTRLNIIDLDSRSNQPFFLNGCYLVFNGEIYNYRELRQELEKAGAIFRTESDTEVLLHAYLKYGDRCVEHFEGMWAFAIYDTGQKQLFLSRDRFAEKPLYYLETDDGIYFGSEIKFLRLLSERSLGVNQRQVLRYLVNGYKALYKQPETYFEGVKELPFATNALTNGCGPLRCRRYWIPSSQTRDMTLSEAIEGTRYHLLESMKIRLRADVPLAFCLSGGVDSASIVSIAAKKFRYNVSTFSIIDNDERYNELENIQATIDDIGCKHTLIHLDYGNVIEQLRDLIIYHDAPVATITYLVHSYLSKAIKENGYRVAFSGTAADELFAGYYDHFYLHLYEMRNNAEYTKCLRDWQEYTGKFVRNPFFKDPELYFKNPSFRRHIYLHNDVFRSYLKGPFEEDFFEESMANGLLRNRMLNELFHEATPVVLHEDDLNSMRYSVENRSPFLDRRLFEFAYSIPKKYLIRNGYGKYVLREAMKGILNDHVRLDRRKKGFNASITSIVNFADNATREYLLSDSPIYNIVDKSKIETLLKNVTLEDSFNKFIFNFINAKIFLEEFGRCDTVSVV
jgi:asparagine synthase (glutamine-hydrolysing)